MATIGKFFTRFSIFLYCSVGFLFVSLRHILVNGYSHRAGFMVMLGLAFLAAAVTDKKKRQLQAWREEQERRLKEEIQKKNNKGGK
ncbi:MAG: hypothetical protein ACXU9L_06760 [Thermodesulfobacteriota bacterium]